MKQKKAAMELSIGTIVVIVLAVMALVLGIFLTQKIFSSAKGAIDLTDQQLRNELSKLFTEESKTTIYPGTRYIEIKQDSTDGVGFAIRNLLSGGGTTEFSYSVVASDSDLETKCGIDKEVAESWIVTGKSESDIPIASGDFSVQKILFEIPVGSPLCTMRFRINVDSLVDNEMVAYDTDFFDLKIKPK